MCSSVSACSTEMLTGRQLGQRGKKRANLFCSQSVGALIKLPHQLASGPLAPTGPIEPADYLCRLAASAALEPEDTIGTKTRQVSAQTLRQQRNTTCCTSGSPKKWPAVPLLCPFFQTLFQNSTPLRLVLFLFLFLLIFLFLFLLLFTRLPAPNTDTRDSFSPLFSFPRLPFDTAYCSAQARSIICE